MKTFYFTILIIILLIVGCSTPYQPYGLLGGYKSSKLDDNSYRILFKGNQHTNGETVYNNLERRCAEITIENGYSHFIIYEDSSHIDKTVFDNEPGIYDKISAHRSDNYLLGKQPAIDTNPRQTLNDQKTNIGRTYWNGTIDNITTDVVGILKIQLFNEVRKGFENQYISAEQILEKYKAE